jgi:membrane-associated phospholipid phosphatase
MTTSGATDASEAVRPPRGGQLLIAAVLLATFLGLYILAAHVGQNAATTRLPLDDAWRLIPLMVWVYVSPYLIGVVVISLLPQPVFRAFVARGIVLGVVHTVVNFLLPTRVDRAPVPETLVGPSAAVLRLVYAVDNPPLNAAPSAHVSFTMLITWAAWHGLPPLRVPFLAWGVAVVLSVLFTGQHHLIDVVTGAGLVAVLLIAFQMRERRTPS